ncbi:MAG: energy transducer TonB [Pseudomonadota bacterium]|jgi:protein TonB
MLAVKINADKLLPLALGISLTVHAAALAVRLSPPEAIDRLVRDAGLEVILVNTNSDEKAPVKPKAIAQTHLAGGGETTNDRSTSPLLNSPSTRSGQADDQVQQKLSAKEREQAELLTRTKQTLAKLNTSHSDNKDPAIERQRQQLINLLAQIEKRIQEENARPRKRYVSPSTQEASYAKYYDLMRRKIEERGTREFPQHQGDKLYGSLIMVITIDARGQILSADVSQSSGNPLLDFQAKQIAKNAGPYGVFSDKMRREMDQLALVTRFSFDHNNMLKTTLQAE